MAFKIVRAYAEVLGKTAKRMLPLPESLLVHKTAAIKEAITVVMRLTEDDSTAACVLEEAYLHLADFVPDEVAARTHGRTKSRSASQAEYPRRASRRMAEIRDRRRALLDEFRSIQHDS